MNEVTESEYFIAACSDIAYEGLTLEAVHNAYIVSSSAADFFEAIQAAVWLKGVCDDKVS